MCLEHTLTIFFKKQRLREVFFDEEVAEKTCDVDITLLGFEFYSGLWEVCTACAVLHVRLCRFVLTLGFAMSTVKGDVASFAETGLKKLAWFLVFLSRATEAGAGEKSPGEHGWRVRV